MPPVGHDLDLRSPPHMSHMTSGVHLLHLGLCHFPSQTRDIEYRWVGLVAPRLHKHVLSSNLWQEAHQPKINNDICITAIDTYSVHMVPVFVLRFNFGTLNM